MKKELNQIIAKVLEDEGIKDISFTVEYPANMKFGDYSTNVALVASKILNKNPKKLAEELSEKIKLFLQKENEKRIEKIETAGQGFINFFLSKNFYIEVLKKIEKEKENFGKNKIGGGKKVVIDYSSPNIAKPFTVGHLRSTIIGDSIANTLKFSGFDVVRDNHLGDWGTQFGKQIVAIEKWGGLDELKKSENKIAYLVDLYVKFHSEADKEPKLDDLARARFGDLEKGEEVATKIYKEIVSYSMEYFDSIYKRLKISDFDTAYGESFFGPFMPPVLEELKAKNLAKESEGALAVFFEGEKLPPFLVQKKDGSTLYGTRDLATDKHRLDTYGKDTLIINETGSEQILHFKQLFETEKMLGWVKEGQRVHVAHGLYRFKEGKMSTRSGNVIWLENIIDEAIKRAEEINKEVAEDVAIGAIKFNDLKRESIQNINFDWNEVLNLKGDSGPYLQYSFARANSVLKKAKEEGISKFEGVEAKKEMGAMKKESFGVAPKGKVEEISGLEKLLSRFPEVVERSALEYKPHYISSYLIDLAGAFNNYYAKNQIVSKDDENSSYRILLTEGFSIVLKNGLKLLGIPVLEKM